MVVEIEYYKGDTLLFGKVGNTIELRKQLDFIESVYDRETDNFIEMFCRNFQWTVLKTNDKPDYTYDRDVKKLYKTII